MYYRLLFLTAALLIIGLPSPSLAMKLSVSYLVDSETLKKNTVLGDPLTFELYSDDGCSTMIYDEAIEAGSPDLLIEKVTSEKLKKQKPKPPNAARLQTTLFPAEIIDQFFLRVTGNGIVPVGDECQPLFPHPVQAVGSSSSGIILRDANDAYIGRPISSTHYAREIGGRAREFGIENRVFEQNSLLLKYESDDCTGPPLINEETDRLYGSTVIRDGTLFYRPLIGEGTQIELFSQLHQKNNLDNVTACNNLCSGNPGCTSVFFTSPLSCCLQFAAGKMEALAPAETLDLTQFQEPFHVEVISPE